MTTMSDLYREDLILKSKANTKEKVLTEVGNYLYAKGLVKRSFINAIIEREEEYPTGIDLSPVAEGLANVAIPHTDTKHCKEQAVVFVKLTKGIIFNNMIKPEEELEVYYLFLIINNQKRNQINVLSELMDFMTTEEYMHKLDTLDSEAEIYEFLLSKKGVTNND